MTIDAVRWHNQRRSTLLKNHPALRELQGPSAWTGLWIVLLVAVQVGLAIALRSAPWYALVICAAAIGAVASHAVGVLIHECAHNLVAKGNGPNKLWGIIANTPLVIPGAMDFRKHHMAHHRHLGEGIPNDTQAPAPREVEVVGRSGWRKMLWLTIGPLFSAGKHAAEQEKWGAWDTFNVVWQIATMSLLVAFAGLRPLIYLAVSSLMAFSLHPVGIRRYAEHLTGRLGQPTNSYYGAMNALAFNVGYHVEHHDLPAIPWNRLPQLRSMAPEFYSELFRVESWTRLWLDFASDERFGVEHYANFTDQMIQGLDEPSPVVPTAEPSLRHH